MSKGRKISRSALANSLILCLSCASVAHASIVDYSSRTGATALHGLIYEFESRAIGCTQKAGSYIVMSTAPKYGEIKTIVAKPLTEAGSKAKEPVTFSLDYSDLSMVESSYVPTLIKKGQRLAIEFYECPSTQSKDVISARKLP